MAPGHIVETQSERAPRNRVRDCKMGFCLHYISKGWRSYHSSDCRDVFIWGSTVGGLVVNTLETRLNFCWTPARQNPTVRRWLRPLGCRSARQNWRKAEQQSSTSWTNDNRGDICLSTRNATSSGTWDSRNAPIRADLGAQSLFLYHPAIDTWSVFNRERGRCSTTLPSVVGSEGWGELLLHTSTTWWSGYP